MDELMNVFSTHCKLRAQDLDTSESDTDDDAPRDSVPHLHQSDDDDDDDDEDYQADEEIHDDHSDHGGNDDHDHHHTDDDDDDDDDQARSGDMNSGNEGDNDDNSDDNDDNDDDDDQAEEEEEQQQQEHEQEAAPEPQPEATMPRRQLTVSYTTPGTGDTTDTSSGATSGDPPQPRRKIIRLDLGPDPFFFRDDGSVEYKRGIDVVVIPHGVHPLTPDRMITLRRLRPTWCVHIVGGLDYAMANFEAATIRLAQEIRIVMRGIENVPLRYNLQFQTLHRDRGPYWLPEQFEQFVWIACDRAALIDTTPISMNADDEGTSSASVYRP